MVQANTCLTGLQGSDLNRRPQTESGIWAPGGIAGVRHEVEGPGVWNRMRKAMARRQSGVRLDTRMDQPVATSET